MVILYDILAFVLLQKCLLSMHRQIISCVFDRKVSRIIALPSRPKDHDIQLLLYIILQFRKRQR